MPSILVLVGGEEEVTARGLEEGGCRGGVYWLMGELPVTVTQLRETAGNALQTLAEARTS